MVSKYANYRQIGGPDGHLANLRKFTGNTMSGGTLMDGSYCVWSYTTMIASTKDDVTIVVDNRWGPTTARHINLCRAWLKPLYEEYLLRERKQRELGESNARED